MPATVAPRRGREGEMTDIAVGDAHFDFGRVIGQTFGLIGRNFFAFALLALLLVGVPRFAMMYAQAFLMADRPDLAGTRLL